jgi:hypothetical protein
MSNPFPVPDEKFKSLSKAALKPDGATMARRCSTSLPMIGLPKYLFDSAQSDSPLSQARQLFCSRHTLVGPFRANYSSSTPSLWTVNASCSTL